MILIISLFLYNSIAFDSSQEHEFMFQATGNQVVKNKLTIKNNETNEIVYDEIQVTMQLKHTLPANTLTNGICYNATLIAYDVDDNPSASSNAIIFYCYTTPIWEFSNITEGQILGNSSYIVELSYIQGEGELLNDYQLILYDQSQQEIYDTGILYDVDNLSNKINALLDNTQYYLRAIGNTVNGMSIDTGYISVSVSYTTTENYAFMHLENNKEQRNISLETDFVIVNGTSTNTPVYINDSSIDLTNNSVTFDSGFNIENDFTLQAIGRKFNSCTTVLTLNNGISNIKIKYMLGAFNVYDFDEEVLMDKTYFVLEVNDVLTYRIASNKIDIPNDTDWIYVWVRRIGNLYDIKIENMGG